MHIKPFKKIHKTPIILWRFIFQFLPLEERFVCGSVCVFFWKGLQDRFAWLVPNQRSWDVHVTIKKLNYWLHVFPCLVINRLMIVGHESPDSQDSQDSQDSHGS